MKKFAATFATISLLILPGLAAAQSYGYGYPNYSNYGYSTPVSSNPYYPQIQEYFCNGEFSYMPCATYYPTYNTYQMMYQPSYQYSQYPQYQPSYSTYSPRTYMMPQTYMPRAQYSPQQYYNPPMYNTNVNTNTNNNNNNINIVNTASAYSYTPYYYGGYIWW